MREKFCGAVKGRPASLYVGWVSEAHPPRQAILLNNGLSPLAPGTPETLLCRVLYVRFIPARAGNTASKILELRVTAVYPRSRGEHRQEEGVKNKPYGLSPLARGTRYISTGRTVRRRFIPARAGNTRSARTATIPSAVYPRSRGEHPTTCTASPSASGLSPLARGTPRFKAVIQWPARFIPARAGNTIINATPEMLITVYPRSRGEHSKTIYLYLLHFFVQQHPTNVWFTISHC